MYVLIPDDAVVVIYQDEATVKEHINHENLVVYAGTTGFPGSLDTTALAHRDNRDNPHLDSFNNLELPTGQYSKWMKIGIDGIETTHEVPLYPEDIHPPVSEDGLVKVDEDGIAGTLADVASFPLHTTKHLRLRGDYSEKHLSVVENSYTETIMVQQGAFVQPILTTNGTLGGTSFGVAAIEYSSSNAAYKAFNNDEAYWHSPAIAYYSNVELFFYNPFALKIDSIDITNRTDSSSVWPAKAVYLYGSEDGVYYVLLASKTNTPLTQSATYNFVINSPTYYKYHKAVFTANSNYVVVKRFSINGRFMEFTNEQVENNMTVDVSKKIAPRMFYGTNPTGTVGFNLVPGKKVIP